MHDLIKNSGMAIKALMTEGKSLLLRTLRKILSLRTLKGILSKRNLKRTLSLRNLKTTLSMKILRNFLGIGFLVMVYGRVGYGDKFSYEKFGHLKIPAT